MASLTLSDLRRPVHLREALLRGWQWWLGHFRIALDLVVPDSLRERILDVALTAGRSSLEIRFSDQTLALSPHPDEKDLAAYANDIAVAGRIHKADRILATVNLLPDYYVAKKITLPAAARDNLHEAAGYQLDLETPFRATEVHYGVQPLTYTTASTLLELSVAPRKLIDRLVHIAERLGVTVAMLVAIPSNSSGAGIPLSSFAQASSPGHWRRPGIATAALTLIMLATCAAPLAFKFVEVKSLAATAETDVELAQPIIAAHREVLGKVKQQSMVNDAIGSFPDPIELLAELTGSIPQDSWLGHISIRSGEVQISGLTPSTSSLIDHLTKTGLFYPPTYAAPAMQDAQFGIERFVLNIRMRPAL